MQRIGGTALHSGKDLAVSFSLFYPYSETKPTDLGLGLFGPLESNRFCSHLCIATDELALATLLLLFKVNVRTFLQLYSETKPAIV